MSGNIGSITRIVKTPASLDKSSSREGDIDDVVLTSVHSDDAGDACRPGTFSSGQLSPATGSACAILVAGRFVSVEGRHPAPDDARFRVSLGRRFVTQESRLVATANGDRFRVELADA